MSEMEKKIRVLISDDDPGMRETLSDILSEMGHEVVTAGDGFEAIKLAKERPFDLAFIDIKMPVLNGVDTFKEIQRLQPEIKVVMITAFALDELIDEARRFGALDVLFKPLKIDNLKGFLNICGAEPRSAG